MSDMLQLVGSCHSFNCFQERAAEILLLLKDVEYTARPDKLKHIGHLLVAFP
jgi:hypothetical protein